MYTPGIYDIIVVSVYIIILAMIFIRHQCLCKWRWGTGSFILLSYVLYPIIGAFWFFSPSLEYGEIDALRLWPFLYLIAMLIIASYPSLRYDRNNITSIEPPSMYLLHIFSTIYILCALSCIPHLISNIGSGIVQIMLDSTAGAELYSDTLSANSDATFDASISHLNIIIFNIFSTIATFLFFYFLTFGKKYKWHIIGYGCCILLRILDSLASGQRTGITMTIFDVIVGYGAVKYILPLQIQKVIRKILVILGILVAIPFLALSASRFSDKDGGVYSSIVYYIGEAPYYFNINAMDAGGTRHGDRTCNVFKKLIGMSSPDGEFGVRDEYPDLKMDDSIFSTFVGDFVLDFGPIITALLFIVFSILFTTITPRSAPNKIPLHRLILVYFAMCVCMEGGMYLYSYSFRGNLYIIAIALFYLVFLIDYHLRLRFIANIKQRNEKSNIYSNSHV